MLDVGPGFHPVRLRVHAVVLWSAAISIALRSRDLISPEYPGSLRESPVISDLAIELGGTFQHTSRSADLFAPTLVCWRSDAVPEVSAVAVHAIQEIWRRA